MSRRLLTLIWPLMLGNAAVLVGVVAARESEPIEDVRITTQKDGVLVFGNNAFGMLSIKVFSSWPETQAYLDHRKLKPPTLSYAERGWAADAMVRHSTGSYYKVVWNLRAKNVPLLLAPDAISAVTMADYARFKGLVPSRFGYSLPVE